MILLVYGKNYQRTQNINDNKQWMLKKKPGKLHLHQERYTITNSNEFIVANVITICACRFNRLLIQEILGFSRKNCTPALRISILTKLTPWISSRFYHNPSGTSRNFNDFYSSPWTFPFDILNRGVINSFF